MKDYELTVMFHPDLEMNLDPALDKVKKLIETNKGKIITEEIDGKKRLAYAISKHQYAVFCYFTVQLPPEAPAKINSVLNITDEVLRHLLVRIDEKRAKYLASKTTNNNSNAEKGE